MSFSLKEIREFGNLELLARQLVEGFITGLHKSPYHGFSVEFAEHKLYNSGESIRNIDWKVFARTDRLYTKRYEEETNLRCQLVIDRSASMYYPTDDHGKLTFSIMACAALAYLLHKQRDAFGFTTFSDSIEAQSPIKSTHSHLHKLYMMLDDLRKEAPPQTPTAVAKVLHEIAEKIHRRSLIVLFSDMFDQEDPEELFKALQHLKHNKHEVIVFHVFDEPTEMSFEFEERPYEFVDLESKEKVKLFPSQVARSYKREILEFFNTLKYRCGQLKIDFIEANIRAGFSQVLNAYLIKRTRMK